ncbi:MAG: hypothetical protein ACK56I_32330, partial [bacterium]
MGATDAGAGLASGVAEATGFTVDATPGDAPAAAPETTDTDSFGAVVDPAADDVGAAAGATSAPGTAAGAAAAG